MSDMSLRRGGDPKSFSSTFSSPYAALPLYSPAPSSPTPSSRYAPPQHTPVLARPSLARFLADFTLGFADGLTVPFALTAGLSSLGQTDTVIYAGMAEICAGSISMGIGGYLSAKGEQQQQQTTDTASASSRADEEESSLGWADEKASHHLAAATVERYLAPLALPSEVQDLVRDHVQGRDDVVAALARQLQGGGGGDDNDDEEPLSPIMSGLSVALGYLIGGSLPLFPYFVVSQVGDGLMWSFIVCIIALFSFGFTKDLVLHIRKESDRWVKDKDLGKRRWGWSDIRRSSWEGLQMVLLGSMAALAAVLCVRWFENMGHEQA